MNDLLVQYYFTKNENKLYILLKENEEIIGYIYLNRIGDDTWEIPTVAALKGNGHKMHSLAMNIVYPDWVMPYRQKQIVPNLYKTYEKFIDREDIVTKHLEEDEEYYIAVSEENDNWFNRKYKLRDINEQPIYNIVEDETGKIKYEGLKFFNKLYNFKGEDSYIK